VTFLIDPPADDAEAKDILTVAYTEKFGEPVNLFALGIAQAIGLMEGGGYGKNFGNNWGAITRAPNSDGSCPADSFVHGDSSFELGEYQTCFRKYPTSLDGARGLLAELYERRPEVFSAALAGDIRGVAEEMYASNYYLGTAPPDKRDADGHYTNVNNYIKFIGKGVDQIEHLYPSGSVSSSSGMGIALAVSAVAVLGFALVIK
jgi:hypothetical protein